eukprot:TRINITY_DN7268_c0_g1_i1.p1 TRINITY_DN7268_c0_g1~~TRINITY_DN7268_c0_g1_i1.p1  ORF type:complete len:1042 (+),score=160.02 TRINITY_DN7268_c0_g1_i1:79-3204(+)
MALQIRSQDEVAQAAIALRCCGCGAGVEAGELIGDGKKSYHVGCLGGFTPDACRGCNEVIHPDEGYCTALGDAWHENCFICKVCNQHITTPFSVLAVGCFRAIVRRKGQTIGEIAFKKVNSGPCHPICKPLLMAPPPSPCAPSTVSAGGHVGQVSTQHAKNLAFRRKSHIGTEHIPAVVELDGAMWDVAPLTRMATCIQDTTQRARVKIAEHSEINTIVTGLRTAFGPGVLEVLGTVRISANKSLLMTPWKGGGDLYTQAADSQGMGLDEGFAQIVFDKVIGALVRCHKKGLAHRDIRPENIILGSLTNGPPYLTGFKLSRKYTPNDSSTYPSDVCGGPGHIAPEALDVLLGKRNFYDPFKADMWAAGVLLHQMLSGRDPKWVRKIPLGLLPDESGLGNNPRQVEIAKYYDAIMKGAGRTPDTVSEEALELLSWLLVTDPDDRVTAEQAAAHPWLASLRVDGHEGRKLVKQATSTSIALVITAAGICCVKQKYISACTSSLVTSALAIVAVRSTEYLNFKNLACYCVAGLVILKHEIRHQAALQLQAQLAEVQALKVEEEEKLLTDEECIEFPVSGVLAARRESLPCLNYSSSSEEAISPYYDMRAHAKRRQSLPVFGEGKSYTEIAAAAVAQAMREAVKQKDSPNTHRSDKSEVIASSRKKMRRFSSASTRRGSVVVKGLSSLNGKKASTGSSYSTSTPKRKSSIHFNLNLAQQSAPSADDTQIDSGRVTTGRSSPGARMTPRQSIDETGRPPASPRTPRTPRKSETDSCLEIKDTKYLDDLETDSEEEDESLDIVPTPIVDPNDLVITQVTPAIKKLDDTKMMRQVLSETDSDEVSPRTRERRVRIAEQTEGFSPSDGSERGGEPKKKRPPKKGKKKLPDLDMKKLGGSSSQLSRGGSSPRMVRAQSSSPTFADKNRKRGSSTSKGSPTFRDRGKHTSASPRSRKKPDPTGLQEEMRIAESYFGSFGRGKPRKPKAPEPEQISPPSSPGRVKAQPPKPHLTSTSAIYKAVFGSEEAVPEPQPTSSRDLRRVHRPTGPGG